MSMAQTVESMLVDRHVDFTTHAHRASRSSLDSAHSAHVDEGSVAKSVVLADERGFVLAVLPASKRLELDWLRDELGRSFHLATEREVVPLFPDCVVGAVPPVGQAYGLATVVDASLEDLDEIFFEGGDHETLVRVDGDAFLDLLENADVAEIASETPGLSHARTLRERLYDAQLRLGRAITAPIGSGRRWRLRVERALGDVEQALDVHTRETEGADGMHREVIEQAPRLWREVDALCLEHVELAGGCRHLRERLERMASASVIRHEAYGLIRRFEEHRHRGADLVYEAFGVDMGGG